MMKNGPAVEIVVGRIVTEAIVRVAPNNSDLYMGHNTWTGYYSMLRLLKDCSELTSTV
jgi:hypothetical protein